MDIVSLKALAKINLGLDVIGKRENGYHDVKMVIQSIQLYDRVEMKRLKSNTIKVESNLFYLPGDETNLAYKAAKMMKEEFDIKEGIRITLQKYIPMAAGLGGGSADAAAVIIGMNRIFKLGAKQPKLIELGTKIGADVPFCIMRGTVLAEGIGEHLTPLPPMPKCPVLIAKPAVSVSTAEVYGNLKLYEGMEHPDIDGLIEEIKNKNLKGIAKKMGNVLETVTIPKNPVVGEIKKLMINNGALNAMMSGSGPSVFGLFQNEKELGVAYDELKKSDYVKELFASELFISKH